MADKYTDADRKAMAAKGHAMPDGSFPIADAEDVGNAVKAVGRGGADHDAIRRHVIKRAKALGESAQIPDTWNADGSLQGASALHDPRWEQRRKRWAGSLLRQPARRSMRMEMRSKPDGSGGTTFEFEGYGAVFDAPFTMWDPWGDQYTEVVRPGAFTRTLQTRGLYVPFLIGHNDKGIPLAQTANGTMKLSQDTRGLHVLAQMDGRRSDVRDLAYAVERGDMDQMSIGFVTEQQEWSKDYEQRSMLDLELHNGDVSSVAIAANPATAGAMMTALPVESLGRREPAELRAAFEVDSTDGPDYDPQPHVAPDHMVCQSPDCTVDGGALNSPDARYCDQCGSSLYSEDGTIVLGDSGVPEELEGDAAQALALAKADLELRRRRLALLAG